ncbi:MAG TPA: hypothetical protein VN426_00870 [Syntrophomonadaceae bacterium]|nr:hypothetical protein [Syntrophomonadaceae bacterium]
MNWDLFPDNLKTIKMIEVCIDQHKQKLALGCYPVEEKDNLFLFNRILGLAYAGLFRSCQYLCGVLLCINENNLMSSYWLARAEIENLGSMSYMLKEIEEFLLHGDLDSLHRKFNQLEYGSTSLEGSEGHCSPIQIIGSMVTEDRDVLLETYRHLGEVCHPSWNGTASKKIEYSRRVGFSEVVVDEDLFFIPCVAGCANQALRLYDLLLHRVEECIQQLIERYFSHDHD